MHSFRKISLSFFITTIFISPTASIGSSQRIEKEFRGVVRQCEYDDGVILRVLATRQCPELKTTAQPPTHVSPPQIGGLKGGQTTQQISPSRDIQDKASAVADVILDRAVSRCTTIGYVRGTDDFRNCVSKQIDLISK